MKNSVQNQLVFVYGSLMRNGSAEDLLSGCTYSGKAILKDFAMFNLRRYPGIISKRGEWVEGELYIIHNNDFARLDQYEGEGILYQRELVTVESSTGQKQAWAYIYLGKPEGKPMQRPWISDKDDVVWYASYGSNLSKERFLCYIKGGICAANGKEYKPCTNPKLVSEKDDHAWFPGQMYFGNESGSWGDKGVAFYDPNAVGKTFMRMFKVTREQLWEIQGKEGRCPEWYGRILALGIHADGCPIYTMTSEYRHPFNAPDKSYINLISRALIEENGFSEKEAEDYLTKCLDKKMKKTVIVKDNRKSETAKMEITYKQWIEQHANDLAWIVEMAYNGIHVTPDAGNHPSNLVLYMLACDVDSALQKKGQK